MARISTPISLTEEDRTTLERWVRSATTEQRFVLRAQIILAAAEGQQTEQIAKQRDIRKATVSKWRTRFAKLGLASLQDAPRPVPRSGMTRRPSTASLIWRLKTRRRGMRRGPLSFWPTHWVTCPSITYGESCASMASTCSGVTRIA